MAGRLLEDLAEIIDVLKAALLCNFTDGASGIGQKLFGPGDPH